jgi:hypothetical protein
MPISLKFFKPVMLFKCSDYATFSRIKDLTLKKEHIDENLTVVGCLQKKCFVVATGC